VTAIRDEMSREELLAENESLRWQLEESRETLRAIGSGEVDAFVVSGADGPQVFALKGAEQPYRIMVETMNEGAATLASDGTILYGNRALATLLQMPLEKVVGREFRSLVAPAYVPIVSARIAACAVQNCQDEIQVLNAAGEQVPVLLSCCCFELPGSLGITIVLTDLTQQKRNAEVVASEKLARSMVVERTEQLAATVETLRGEIVERERVEDSLLRLNRLYLVLSEINHAIICTRDRKLLFNEFCRIAVEDGGFKLAWIGLWDGGADLSVVASHGATDFLEETTFPTAALFPAFTGRDRSECGAYVICNDFLSSPSTALWHERGAKCGIRAFASIPLSENGEVVGALLLYADEQGFFDQQQIVLLKQIGADFSFAMENIFRDAERERTERALHVETTQRLRTVEALREKEHMLIQQSRQAAMGEMISNIAHQWRQPLNTLALGIQEMALMHELGRCDLPYMKKSVRKSMDLIQHMSQTIDDFRNYFRPEKQKVEFHLSQVIESTLMLIEDSFKHQRVEIQVLEAETPVILGFRNELAQALLNILNNARDALAEKGIENPKVTIATGMDGERAVLTVADNAGGIPDDIITKIFDPYFTTKSHQSGTGLGLFMSKTIIEKSLGGRLSVRNLPDGAEFMIEV
jgi:PAS domain S-box-containing protein